MINIKNATDVIIPNGVKLLNCVSAFSGKKQLINVTFLDNKTTNIVGICSNCQNLISTPFCGRRNNLCIQSRLILLK